MSEVEKSGNMLKYENYREQFKRLRRALDAEFYLEVIFIEYAILEDRTESVLRHAEMWEAYVKSRKGRDPSIDSKIRYIKKLAEQKKSLPNKYFSDDLLDRALAWKEERNRLIHALLKQQLEHGEIKTLAAEGKLLSDEVRNRVSNFNRAVERRKTREVKQGR